MIDTGMWSNENFAALPAMGRLLLIGVITLADDQGRCKANPAYLRSQIFPYDDITTGEINAWLEQMATNGTIILYDVAGKAYLQLSNWWEYQPLDWARPSDYPSPDGWQDRIRFNAKGNVNLTHNWRTKSGICPPDTCDTRGVPTQASTQVPTIVPTIVPTQASTQVNKTKLNKSNSSSSSHDDWRLVVDCYHAEIGVITAFVSEEIKAYYDEMGAHILIDAFKEASRNNVRKWSYVDSILKKWRANGRQSSSKDDSANAWQQLNGNTPDYMKG